MQNEHQYFTVERGLPARLVSRSEAAEIYDKKLPGMRIFCVDEDSLIFEIKRNSTLGHMEFVTVN